MTEKGEEETRSEAIDEAESSTPRILRVLSFALDKLVNRNDQIVQVGSTMTMSKEEEGEGEEEEEEEGQGGGGGEGGWLGKRLKVFDGVRAPNISIGKYLERIYKYTNCSPSCFVLGYVYIDRMVHRHPDSLVVSLNVHRLLVTSVMLAAKVLDDAHYNNAFYARVGGISNAELNRLELELLFLLDFGVVVSSRIFESYCLHLEKEMEMKMKMKMGGVGQRIERLLITSNNSMDDETEISVEEDTSSYTVD